MKAKTFICSFLIFHLLSCVCSHRKSLLVAADGTACCTSAPPSRTPDTRRDPSCSANSCKIFKNNKGVWDSHRPYMAKNVQWWRNSLWGFAMKTAHSKFTRCLFQQRLGELFYWRVKYLWTLARAHLVCSVNTPWLYSIREQKSMLQSISPLPHAQDTNPMSAQKQGPVYTFNAQKRPLLIATVRHKIQKQKVPTPPASHTASCLQPPTSHTASCLQPPPATGSTHS